MVAADETESPVHNGEDVLIEGEIMFVPKKAFIILVFFCFGGHNGALKQLSQLF